MLSVGCFMSEFRFESNASFSKDAAVMFRGASPERLAATHKPRLLMVGMHLTRTRGGISTLTSSIGEMVLSVVDRRGHSRR